MKILMVNVVCGIRSTGRICTDLADALTEQGHEVKIAYGRECVPEKYQKYAVRIGTDLDVKLHGIKARLFDKAGFGSASSTKRFIEWVKEYDPDVIHLHNVHGYYINIEILFNYLKTCGKKILWTLHDCWAFTGHTAYCDAINCTKWKNGCGKCPNLKEYPMSYSDNSTNNWIKKKELMTGVPNMTIITPSHWLAGLVKESFLSEYPVKVIHNGIDTDIFKPTENDFKEFYGIKDKFMLLGAATAWNDMKGLSDFIKLSSILDDKYKIVLVGLTEKQIAELPANILGINATSSVKELAKIYSAADLFLNLSYCENYPTVNLESICCGTPILTYDTGGSTETLTDLRSIVVERGNYQKAAEETVRYCESHLEDNNNERIEDEVAKRMNKEITLALYLNEIRGGYWKCKNKLGLIGKYVILGVASVWEKRKGFDDFIKLSQLLNDDYRIVLVGLTDNQIQSLPSNVIGIKRTNSAKELAEIYSIADVFLNLTYEDNYPTVNLEAQACGTPVITYDTGGSGESVPDENIIRKCDFDKLICIGSLSIASQEFTIKAMIAQYISIYN